LEIEARGARSLAAGKAAAAAAAISERKGSSFMIEKYAYCSWKINE